MFGGLDDRRVSLLALSTGLASAESTPLLQGEIFSGSEQLSDKLGESLKNCWTAIYGPVPTDQSASSP